MTRNQNVSELVVERYKYILDQKRDLNERTFKIVAIYQAVVLAIAVGQFQVSSDTARTSLKPETAIVATWSLFAIFAFISVFSAVLIIGGIAAWLNYRRDEANIEIDVLGCSRPAPRFRDAFKWYETYILLAFASGMALYYFVVVNYIVPTIAIAGGG